MCETNLLYWATEKVTSKAVCKIKKTWNLGWGYFLELRISLEFCYLFFLQIV